MSAAVLLIPVPQVSSGAHFDSFRNSAYNFRGMQKPIILKSVAKLICCKPYTNGLVQPDVQ
jgi:hypothetical protein